MAARSRQTRPWSRVCRRLDHSRNLPGARQCKNYGYMNTTSVKPGFGTVPRSPSSSHLLRQLRQTRFRNPGGCPAVIFCPINHPIGSQFLRWGLPLGASLDFLRNCPQLKLFFPCHSFSVVPISGFEITCTHRSRQTRLSISTKRLLQCHRDWPFSRYT